MFDRQAKQDMLKSKIEAMEKKLAETKDDAKFNRGPVNDALQVVIPMMEDQLQITKDLLALTLDRTMFS
jgi:hypothetical protein